MNSKKEISVDKLKNIQVDRKTVNSGNDLTAFTKTDVAESTNGKIQIEYKKCFKKEIKVENIESMKTAILQQKDYSTPVVNEENYDLETANKANLVVQYIPQEENKNKVRVFSINPTDSLPDRVKDFPNKEAEVSLRLKGALTLGTIKSKTSTTIQNSYDGSMLSLEEKDNKIVRLHLITNSFDFECKNQSCLCLTKEY